MKQKKMISLQFISAVFLTALLFQLSINSLVAQNSVPDPLFKIDKTGEGRAMILIPGLFCSGKVWDETVAHFKNSYACYEITLPGFAGQPPIQSDSLLKTFARELAGFIRRNKLQKPIIVGHSLGGFIALQLGALYPDLAGELVIVSSAPFLPALSMSAAVTVDSAEKVGLMIKNSMKNLTAEQIRQYQKSSLPSMIRDTEKIAAVAEMAAKSDPATQGEAMYELFSTDLRPEMKKILCPVLVLGDWVSYKKYGATRENTLEKFKAQFSLVKKLKIAINDSSYHFIMYDEPQWFYQQIDDFLRQQQPK